MTIVLVDAKGRVLSKQKTPRKLGGKEKVKEEEKKAPPRGFISRFDGLHVELKLITKDIIRGQLQTNSYNKYDVQITNSEGSFLIPKGAIAYIHLGDKNPKII